MNQTPYPLTVGPWKFRQAQASIYLIVQLQNLHIFENPYAYFLALFSRGNFIESKTRSVKDLECLSDE